MAIFPKMSTDRIVQVEDSLRLDATSTFISKDEAAITLVEIQPEATESFIDVTGTGSNLAKNWFLDWQYSGTSRTVDITVRVTTDGAPVTFTQSLEVITASDDKLFSDDYDLTVKEEDILKWLPDGRTSFKYKHRQVQTMIVEDFNERGVVDRDNNKLTKDAFVDIEEVRQWSLNMVLSLIFKDNSNVVGDIFDQKANNYMSEALTHKHRAFYRLDLNGDGSIDNNEKSPFRTVGLVRR